MAWIDEESNKSSTRGNRNNRKGRTIRKCVFVASGLFVIAALVAFYVALVCQRMHLTVINATASGLNVIACPSNTTTSPFNTTTPPSNTTVLSNQYTTLLHRRHNHAMNSSMNASAPMMSLGNSNMIANAPMMSSGLQMADSSFYLSKVALTLSLLFKNPTPFMGTYHYHQLNWQLAYDNITIANGMIPPFSKGTRHAGSLITLHLTGQNVTLPHAAALALQTKQSVLNLQASTIVHVQLVGKMVDFEFPVSCNLSFPWPDSDGQTRLPSKTACLVTIA